MEEEKLLIASCLRDYFNLAKSILSGKSRMMYFPIVLIYFVSKSSLQAAISGNISLLAAEEPVFGSSERFRFVVKFASDKASLLKDQCYSHPVSEKAHGPVTAYFL